MSKRMNEEDNPVEKEEIKKSKKKKLASNNTIGYRGVYKMGNGYRVVYKEYSGYFDTAKEAAVAYDLAAIQARRPKSSLNFPDMNTSMKDDRKEEEEEEEEEEPGEEEKEQQDESDSSRAGGHVSIAAAVEWWTSSLSNKRDSSSRSSSGRKKKKKKKSGQSSTSSTSSGNGAGKKPRYCTMKAMIDAGVITSGSDVLHVPHKGMDYVATLTSQGEIFFEEKKFKTVSALTAFIKNRPDNGWTSTLYNGRMLSDYRSTEVEGGQGKKKKKKKKSGRRSSSCTSSTSSGNGAGKKPRYCTMKAMIDAGVITSGSDVLHVPHKGMDYVATLTSQGEIFFEEKKFKTVSALTAFIKNRPDNGWTSTLYNGRMLSDYRF